MKEKVKKLEQWLSEGFAFAKSIVFMKKLIFEEGNVLMRAFIYAFKFFFFAYVIYTVNNFIFQWIENQFIRDVIFILFLAFAVLISVGSLMLDVDEMKENYRKEIEQCKNEIKELTAKREQDIKELTAKMEREIRNREHQIRFFKEKYEHYYLSEEKFYELYQKAEETIEKMMSIFFVRENSFGEWKVKPQYAKFKPVMKMWEKYNEFIEAKRRITEQYEKDKKEMELRKEIENITKS